MTFQSALATLFLLLLGPLLHGQDPDKDPPSFHLEPGVVLSDVVFSATVIAIDGEGARDHHFVGKATLTLDRSSSGPLTRELTFAADDSGRLEVGDLTVAAGDAASLRVQSEGRSAAVDLVRVPGWMSIVPPGLAILVAIAFRQVVAALVLGILAGALLVHGFDPVRMLLSFADTYIVQAITGIKPFQTPDASHAQIILFSLLLGGMTGVMSRSGGMHGIVDYLTRLARTRRSGQVATASLGTAIFFDDYANCLIVGNTMRPLTDKLKISREKLAYIVDSTAAPVASLLPLSTWVGYQVGQVNDALKALPGGYPVQAYPMVLEAIPYMFYPIFALLLVFFVAAFGRDVLTMLVAERRAVREGKLLRDGARPLAGGAEDVAMQPVEDKPRRALNAIVPLVGVILVTVIGLAVTGYRNLHLEAGESATIREIIERSDSYTALMWASITGVFLSIGLAVGQRILTVNEAMDACVSGMKAMFLAFVILVLSWSLGDVTGELHAKDYLAGLLGGALDPQMMPVFVFVLAAFTAFATGSSWGTMGILTPLVVPLAHALAIDGGLAPELVHTVLLGSIASVLGGAVFGDHCSPISDTTVLSSMATSCDHIDHVRTQMPYAILAAVFAIGAGYVPVALGYSLWLTLPIGIVVLLLFVRFVGRRVEDG